MTTIHIIWNNNDVFWMGNSLVNATTMLEKLVNSRINFLTKHNFSFDENNVDLYMQSLTFDQIGLCTCNTKHVMDIASKKIIEITNKGPENKLDENKLDGDIEKLKNEIDKKTCPESFIVDKKIYNDFVRNQTNMQNVPPLFINKYMIFQFLDKHKFILESNSNIDNEYNMYIMLHKLFCAWNNTSESNWIDSIDEKYTSLCYLFMSELDENFDAFNLNDSSSFDIFNIDNPCDGQ